MRALTPACPSSRRSTSSRSGFWGLPTALSGHFGLIVVVFGRDADGAYLVDDRGQSPFHVTGRCHGRRSRPDRLVQQPDHRPSNRRPGRSRPTGSGGDARRPGGPGRPPADPLRLVLAARLAEVGPAHDRPAERQGAGRGSSPTATACSDALSRPARDCRRRCRAVRRPPPRAVRRLLDEAAAILDRPALEDAARAWRAVADLWEELADAAVPPDLDGAAEAVEAVETSTMRSWRASREGAARRPSCRLAWAIRQSLCRRVARCRGRVARPSADLGTAWPRSMPPRGRGPRGDGQGDRPLGVVVGPGNQPPED